MVIIIIIIINIFRNQSTMIQAPLIFALQTSARDSEMGTVVVRRLHTQTTLMLANHRPLHHSPSSTTWTSVDHRTQQWVNASSSHIHIQHNSK